MTKRSCGADSGVVGMVRVWMVRGWANMGLCVEVIVMFV